MRWGKGGPGIAVAVVAALVGSVGAACAGGGGSGGDVATGGAGVVEVAGGDLEVVVSEGGFDPPGMLAGVVPDAAGCAVAVGLRDAARGGLEAGRWSSSDCVTFRGPGPSTGEPQGDALPSDDKTLLTAVAARPQGDFVAVGYTEERADDIASDMNVFILSGTGESRRVAVPPPAADRAHQAAEDVLVTQAGTVLVAGVDGPAGGTGATLWRSVDLAGAPVPPEEWTEVPATWEQIPLPVVSPDVVYAAPAQIVQRDDGTLVAVGRASTSPLVTEEDPAAWVSTDDGRTWTAAGADGDLEPEGPQRRFDAVAEIAGGGLVAVGRHGDGGCLWRSDDGMTWSEVAVEGACGEAWTADVVAGDHGVVVVGAAEGVLPLEEAGERHAALWYSAEGAEWVRVDLAPGVAYGAFPTATGFVVLGGSEGYVTWTAQVTVRS